MNKIFKPFILLFKGIYKVIDKIIVTPISRLIYRINEISRDNSGKLEKILNRPNVLIYASLLCAIGIFLLVDTKVINLTESEAEIISDQPVKAIYNKEAYVVEGIPEDVDITLIGSKSTIYLATQLGEHEVVLDLSKYSVGTYKVKLKYNHSVQAVDYKLDPTTVTVKISEKVSDTRALSYDLLNENKLDSKLTISDVKLDNNEIVIKSSQEILDKVATVKALVDTSKVTLTESGKQTIENVTLVAFDNEGNKVQNVEIVPSKVNAEVTIDSYHATKQVKIVTDGQMSNGKAIASITSSVKEVVVYGEKNIIDAIDTVEAKVKIDNLDSEKNTSVTISKPTGVRYMSETKTNVSITVGDATDAVIPGVAVQVVNLGSDYSASAASVPDRTVDVLVKGVQSIIEGNVDATKIKAYVDLAGLKPGTHTVPVQVTIDDERVSVQSMKTEINVKIVNK